MRTDPSKLKRSTEILLHCFNWLQVDHSVNKGLYTTGRFFFFSHANNLHEKKKVKLLTGLGYFHTERKYHAPKKVTLHTYMSSNPSCCAKWTSRQNCPTDILKYICNQPSFRFNSCVRRSNSPFLSLLCRRGVNPKTFSVSRQNFSVNLLFVSVAASLKSLDWNRPLLFKSA